MKNNKNDVKKKLLTELSVMASMTHGGVNIGKMEIPKDSAIRGERIVGLINVIVHRYPADIKAFYMKRDPENPKLALAMDVLAPEGYGEIIGGSQREDDLDQLLERIKEHNLPQEAFEWYLDLRRYGTVPHSGFGLGLERTVSWICGLDHLREAIPFPRMIYRKTP